MKAAVPFWFCLAAIAIAEEPPRAEPVAENAGPVPVGPVKEELVVPGMDRAISRSGQFRVSGGEGAIRGSVAILAEQAKDELLRLTLEKDEWKVPVNIRLHGRQGDPMPARTIARSLFTGDAGYDLGLDIHLSRGLENERFKRAIISSLIYERALRDRAPDAVDTPLNVPPWLVDGLCEASAWRLGTTDRRLYESVFKHRDLLKLDDVFSLDEAGYENLDGATRAAFRVSSGALVMALLEQPQGNEGFRKLLDEAAAFEGEKPALLRRHFPELLLSETSLEKWWALQLANKGTAPLTDALSISDTEEGLNEALRLHFRSDEGVARHAALEAWPELEGLADEERAEAVRPAQDALVRLSYRCFPSYRPLIAEYQIVLSSLVRNQTGKVAEQLAALQSHRETMIAKADRARDYLDWFEITRAKESSGVFDDYLRLKERMKSNPHRREDRLSKYLDQMDKVFDRGEPERRRPANPQDFGIPMPPDLGIPEPLGLPLPEN